MVDCFIKAPSLINFDIYFNFRYIPNFVIIISLVVLFRLVTPTQSIGNDDFASWSVYNVQIKML